MRETAPIDHGLPGYGWTAKKVGCLCRQWYGSSIGTIGRTTLYRYLHQVHLLRFQHEDHLRCNGILRLAINQFLVLPMYHN